MGPETCGREPDLYSNQLKPKLLLLDPAPKVCNGVFAMQCTTKPVPQEDANADKTGILLCGCGSVTCGKPMNFVENSDTEDES